MSTVSASRRGYGVLPSLEWKSSWSSDRLQANCMVGYVKQIEIPKPKRMMRIVGLPIDSRFNSTSPWVASPKCMYAAAPTLE